MLGERAFGLSISTQILGLRLNFAELYVPRKYFLGLPQDPRVQVPVFAASAPPRHESLAPTTAVREAAIPTETWSRYGTTRLWPLESGSGDGRRVSSSQGGMFESSPVGSDCGEDVKGGRGVEIGEVVSEGGHNMGGKGTTVGSDTVGISAIDAFVHMLKSNFGPGTLNLPCAFARVGAVRGCMFLLMISVQGIASMLLLLRTKDKLRQNGVRVRTFTDIGEAAFGAPGRWSVQVMLFLMQLGVCCVFVRLVSTNMEATITYFGGRISEAAATLAVGAVLGMLSLLRTIHELRWLSWAANFIMLVAVFSSTGKALSVISTHPERWPGRDSRATEDNFLFLSSMFYAYEGISLVLPVENSYDPNQVGRKGFGKITVGSFGLVSILMLLLGASCGVAFPDIRSGSITAYLATHERSAWWVVVDLLAAVSVALTFPLQLYPVVRVVNQWFGPGCAPRCRTAAVRADYAATGADDTSRIISTETDEHQGMRVNGVAARESSAALRSELEGGGVGRCGGCEWALRRLGIVGFCTFVALTVDNLALLCALCGSFATPGLIVVAVIFHIKIQYDGLDDSPKVLHAIQASIIVVCLVVFAGTYFVIRELADPA